MVLADDNFATIVIAVKEGRRIYDNIRKSIQFLLSSNLSEVVAIFFSTIMGFVILKPVHLLWINLITDCFPALALGTEKAEADIMKRSPRDKRRYFFWWVVYRYFMARYYDSCNYNNSLLCRALYGKRSLGIC